MTLQVALTGGIASGKTAVSDMFHDLGVTVIDADVVAREVVSPGSEGLTAIVDHFGSEVLLEDGQLDRKKLREMVFSDEAQRAWLNQLLHPMIRERMAKLRQKAENRDEDYVVSVIPLFFETIHGTSEKENYDRVLVVDVAEDVQLRRLLKRDQTDLKQAQAILQSQTSRRERLSIADDVVMNDSDLHSLKQQVIKLDSDYRDLARS